MCLDCDVSVCNFQVDGVLKGLPVQLDHMAVLLLGSLIRVVVDNGTVVTYGQPNLIQIQIPASHRNMCGLCGNVSAVGADEIRPHGLSNDSTFASSWSLSPPGTNCSDECDSCSVCNSTTAAEFASGHLCGMLLDPAGAFSVCHAFVEPHQFFNHCVNDLCRSNNEESLCSSLTEYMFACQHAGAEVKPWRSNKCCEWFLWAFLHVYHSASLITIQVLQLHLNCLKGQFELYFPQHSRALNTPTTVYVLVHAQSPVRLSMMFPAHGLVMKDVSVTLDTNRVEIVVSQLSNAVATTMGNTPRQVNGKIAGISHKFKLNKLRKKQTQMDQSILLVPRLYLWRD